METALWYDFHLGIHRNQQNWRADSAFGPSSSNLISSSPKHTPLVNKHKAVRRLATRSHFIVWQFWKGTEGSSGPETLGQIILFVIPLFFPEWQLKVTFPYTILPVISNFLKWYPIFLCSIGTAVSASKGKPTCTHCSFLYWELYLEPSVTGGKIKLWEPILRAMNYWILRGVVKRANSFPSDGRNIGLVRVWSVGQVGCPSTCGTCVFICSWSSF